jgi:hypothetical protein
MQMSVVSHSCVFDDLFMHGTVLYISQELCRMHRIAGAEFNTFLELLYLVQQG